VGPWGHHRRHPPANTLHEVLEGAIGFREFNIHVYGALWENIFLGAIIREERVLGITELLTIRIHQSAIGQLLHGGGLGLVCFSVFVLHVIEFEELLGAIAHVVFLIGSHLLFDVISSHHHGEV
jgi:hypothetical protein